MSEPINSFPLSTTISETATETVPASAPEAVPEAVPATELSQALQRAYQPIFASRSEFLTVRGLSYHVRRWGNPAGRPIWLLHGWMDVSASYQFLADCLLTIDPTLNLYAPDWRGFGLTDTPGVGQSMHNDAYWFPDYLADLDALLKHFHGDQAIDLIAHSMGGNVAMLYAGARPQRVAHLVNLDAIGLSNGDAALAPKRYAKWLDELQTTEAFAPYASVDGVVARLQKNNPRLPLDKAQFLAPHWSALGDDGKWHIQGDPAHKRSNPIVYRAAEVMACWSAITAPVLLIEPINLSTRTWLKVTDMDERLKHIARLEHQLLDDAGHMLHHDQPQQIAEWVIKFLQK
jgi:pimeloyl-ACP methyl ester carboxylesterase